MQCGGSRGRMTHPAVSTCARTMPFSSGCGEAGKGGACVRERERGAGLRRCEHN